MVDRIRDLLGRIPGYEGYRDKESMRDDDRRLRESSAARLVEVVDDLTAVSARLAAERNLAAIGTVEELVRDTRHLADRVRTATYGYGGLFSDRSIDEAALHQLGAFDVAFDSRIDELADAVGSASAGGTIDAATLEDLRRQLRVLDRLFSGRQDVIAAALPTRNPDTLALLDPPEAPSADEEALLRLRSGGTVSLLGDDHRIEAHMAVSDRGGPVRLLLLRLDGGPSWLAVHNDAGISAWHVMAVPKGDAPTGGASGVASVSGPGGTQNDLPATYDVSTQVELGAESVRMRLLIGSDTHAFGGERVPALDIEIYSEGGNA